MPTQIPPVLMVRPTAGDLRGDRGVFTVHDIRKGLLIAVDPVVLVGFNDIAETSPLFHYQMGWSDTHNALAFGMINMVNHSETPNCEAVPMIGSRSMALLALQEIKTNEELTIRYARTLRFTPRKI